MTGTGEQGVSPASDPAAQPAQSKEVAPAGDPAKPTDPTKVQDPAKPADKPATPPAKSGYDSFPEPAKEVISRMAEKARIEKQRADELEKKLAKIGGGNDDDEPDDEDPRLDEFDKLAQKRGYARKEDILKVIDEREQTKQDQMELETVLKEYDGTNKPKITEEEIAAFLRDARNDPRQSHWVSAPFSEIAERIKQKEIHQMEVDKVLKAGGPPPPTIESGAGGNREPVSNIKRFNSAGDLEAHLRTLGPKP